MRRQHPLFRPVFLASLMVLLLASGCRADRSREGDVDGASAADSDAPSEVSPDRVDAAEAVDEGSSPGVPDEDARPPEPSPDVLPSDATEHEGGEEQEDESEGSDSEVMVSDEGPSDEALSDLDQEISDRVEPDEGPDDLSDIEVLSDAPEVPDLPEGSDSLDVDGPELAAAEDLGPDEDLGEPEPAPTCGECGPDWVPVCADPADGWVVCVDDLPVGVEVPEDPCWHLDVIFCGVGGLCVDEGKPSCICPPSGETMCGNHAYGGEILVESTCGYGGIMATKVFPDGYPPLATCGMPGCDGGTCAENQPSTILWPLPTSVGLYAIDPLGAGDVLVGGVNGAVFQHFDGTWHDRRWLDEVAKVLAVHQEPDGSLVAVTEGPILQWTASSGWFTHSLSSDVVKPPGSKDQGYATRAAVIFGPGDMWLAKQNGWLAHVTDDGVGWIPTGIEDTFDSDLLSVWGPNEGEIWAVGKKGTVLRLVDGVAQSMPGPVIAGSGLSGDIHDVHGDGGGTVVVVQGGMVWRRDADAWTPLFESPEPQAEHDVWVNAPDDMWVAGDRWLHHFDGTSWTSELQEVALPNRLLELACASSEECWATGLFGLVLRWTPTSGWTLASKGQDGDLGPLGYLASQALFVPDDDHVFSAVITGHGETPKGDRVAFVRRFDLEVDPGGTPVVAEVETWPLGPAPFGGDNVGLRGLWGTSATNVFLGTEIPLHFDGEAWAPLDLPEAILETHWASMLKGRDGVLYVALEDKAKTAATVIAKRPANGGPWDFIEADSGFLPGALVVDMAIGPDGSIWVLTGAGGVLSRYDPLGQGWTFISWVGNPFLDCRIEVSNVGEVLVMGGLEPQSFGFADGEILPGAVYYDPGQATGIVLPPSGPGFVATTPIAVLDLFRPEGPDGAAIDVPEADLYGQPVLFQAITPWAYTGLYHTSIAVAASGGLFLGTQGGGLAYVAAP